MSKKLIAVASAAALALTALVGVAPAMASAPSIAWEGTGGTTASAPTEIVVPYNNTVVHDATPDTAVEIVIGTSPALVIGDVVTITATGSVKLLESEITAASANFNASALGKTSLTYTKTNTTAITAYAYTTSTTVGTVKIDIARTGLNTSNTYYIEGTPGLKHTVKNVSGVPATMTATATSVVEFEVYDVFGNVIEDEEAAVSSGTTRTNMGLITWSATKKKYQSTLTSAGTSPFVASLDIGAATVLGMPSPADSIVAVINNTGVAAQITALTAQITALTADYNALAAKWNKRVASKTAPKKKVVLK